MALPRGVPPLMNPGPRPGQQSPGLVWSPLGCRDLLVHMFLTAAVHSVLSGGPGEGWRAALRGQIHPAHAPGAPTFWAPDPSRDTSWPSASFCVSSLHANR